MKQVEAVIFDWAGTTVDYGCMAPIFAMQAAFQQENIPVTLDEIRKPMGMLKLDHIKAVLEMESVKNGFQDVHGREHAITDVEKIYDYFEKTIFSVLNQFTTVIDGVLAVQDFLRDSCIKIGSTTGYTRKMIEIVATSAKQQGYSPDHIISSDEVQQGRPYPFMLHQNLARLNVQDVRNVVKVGDTIVDIQEGLYAGCISVGVIHGSSMLGLTTTEVANLSVNQLEDQSRKVRYKMIAAGAHYVINSIDELPFLLDSIQHKETKHVR
jgi:phosphonoacetaldehyde hydrolase